MEKVLCLVCQVLEDPNLEHYTISIFTTVLHAFDGNYNSNKQVNSIPYVLFGGCHSMEGRSGKAFSFPQKSTANSSVLMKLCMRDSWEMHNQIANVNSVTGKDYPKKFIYAKRFVSSIND